MRDEKKYNNTGADPGGGRIRRPPPPPPPPLKLEKIWFFGVKSWFFTRNAPNIFAPPSARRIFFKCAPPPPPLTWNPGSAPATCIYSWTVEQIGIYIFLLLKATQIWLFAFCVVLIQSIVIFKKKGGTY